jgi:hypothetical protein
VEEHAFSTYDKFINENEEILKLQLAPKVAVDYYQTGDLFMFDAFQYNELKPAIDSSPSSSPSFSSPSTFNDNGVILELELLFLSTKHYLLHILIQIYSP